jgi:hypothetical protein
MTNHNCYPRLPIYIYQIVKFKIVGIWVFSNLYLLGSKYFILSGHRRPNLTVEPAANASVDLDPVRIVRTRGGAINVIDGEDQIWCKWNRTAPTWCCWGV